MFIIIFDNVKSQTIVSHAFLLGEMADFNIRFSSLFANLTRKAIILHEDYEVVFKIFVYTMAKLINKIGNFYLSIHGSLDGTLVNP